MSSVSATKPIFSCSAISTQSESYNASIDWQAKAEEYLAQLSKQYSNLEIHIGNYKDSSVQHLIYQSAWGSHLFISQDFLNAMGKNAESFKNGKQILENAVQELLQPTTEGIINKGILLTEENQTQWSVSMPTKQEPEEQQAQQLQKMFDRMEQNKKAQQETKKRLRIKKNSALSNSVVGIYSRLSRAASSSQVRGVISAANGKLNQIKSAMKEADDTQKKQLQSAATQLQSAIVRSKVKIRQLEKEQHLKRQQQKALAEQQLKEARQKQELLQKQKSNRKGREYAYLRQATIGAYLEQQKATQAQLAAMHSSPTIVVPSAPVMPAVSVGASAPSSVITFSSGASATVSVSPISLSFG